MIRKWLAPIVGDGTTVLPPEAEPIHVAIQQGQLMVWTNDNAGLALLGMPTRVRWFGTGMTPPADSEYVGTVHDEGLVWHLFRLPWTADNEEDRA